MQDQHNIVGPSDHYGVHQHFQQQQQQQQQMQQTHHNHHTSNNNGNSLNNINLNNNGSINNLTNNINHNNNESRSANHQQQKNGRQSREETPVCVLVDMRTPVLFHIPVAPSQITLGDLKQALPAINQPNYKYFFKSVDPEFGIVKEEIQDDHCGLPLYRNRVVAWIVTPNRMNDELSPKAKSESETCNLTYSNTSYGDGSSSLMTTDIESTSYFTETDDDSISCSNYSETTCDTFVSQKRNRHYKGAASGTNGIKSPTYRSYHSNSPYGRHTNNHQHNRSRANNMDTDTWITHSSSPTSSSSSQSDATAVRCLTVHLVLTEENFLGLHIYANAINGVDEGIYVDRVTEASALALDGNIEPGDKVIQVNDINLEELSNEDAVRVLKDVVVKRGPIKLVVAKFVETNKNDAIDGIVSPKEAIHPIDTAAWVAHAQAITIPNAKEHANSVNSSPSFGSNAQDTDCIRPASAGMINLNSGLRLNRGTTDIREIVQHMKTPDIGIEIKDREWLKIRIPDAFLGSDLITWLERNVCFINNREVKKFAGRLLKEGYIRNPLSRKSFSSKSYYTFVI